ncbi:uncharacterized protein DS421_17g581460 [Arachis hypogaea]|nr:uncharacterized protein DS421_17g581460 [Arachis hypogaea]
MVARLIERELTLESQLNAARGRDEDLDKKLADAVSSAAVAKVEVADLKKKNKETVKHARNAIGGTEEAIKAQVKLLVPDFDTSAGGAFKTIKDGKIVDHPKK